MPSPQFVFIMKVKAKTLIFPIFLPMQGCKERCIYCDQFLISSSSGIDHEKQQKLAIEFLQNHAEEKRQLAFYGGTFTALSQSKREKLLQPLMPYMDSKASFRISTHPRYIDRQTLAWCKEHRIKTIELGIQDFTDPVLEACKREYSSIQALAACLLIKSSGFELGVQLMPGLPKSDQQSMISNQIFVKQIKPDFIRLYPTLVIKGTPLHETWEKGEYTALSLEEAVEICASWHEYCDKHKIKIIKMGLPSQMDQSSIVAGPWHPAFGQLVQAELLVRALQKEYQPGARIMLDKNQWSLIVANKQKYLHILQKRIPQCHIEQKFCKIKHNAITG